MVAEPREGGSLFRGMPAQHRPFPEHLLRLWLVLEGVASCFSGCPWGTLSGRPHCLKHVQGSEYRRFQGCVPPLLTSSPHQVRVGAWAGGRPGAEN